MRNYKILNSSSFEFDNFKIVPIRYEDRFEIMKWRNDQIYHLRQGEVLTTEDQENYFKNVVHKLFDQDRPKQILFSFLKDEQLIGYGGLVHINWIDKHAEISFIMKTDLEAEYFVENWSSYLKLIENVAFYQIGLHKIFTYAYDLRPKLYEALESRRFEREAVLKEHCYFDGNFIDVVIHSKSMPIVKLDLMKLSDAETTFRWATNSEIRKHSYSKKTIIFEEHILWFNSKLNNTDSAYFKASINGDLIGSIRFDIERDEALISYLIDPEFHGKGFGKVMLSIGVDKLFRDYSKVSSVVGFVMKENIASSKAFQDLGFIETDAGGNSFKYSKSRNI